MREEGSRNENFPVLTSMDQHMKRSNSELPKQKTNQSFVRSRSNDPGSSHQIPVQYHRSVSLDDGIEQITDLFVDALAMSSESEKRTAFANLALRLSQVTKEDNLDREIFNEEEILSSDPVAPQRSASISQLTDSNSSSINIGCNRADTVDCQPENISTPLTTCVLGKMNVSIGTQGRISDLSCLDSHKAVTDIKRDEDVCVEDLTAAQRQELHNIQVEDAPSTSTGECQLSQSSRNNEGTGHHNKDYEMAQKNESTCDHYKHNDDSASIDHSIDTMTSDQRQQLRNIQEASIEVESIFKPYTKASCLHSIPSGDESDQYDDSVDAALSVSKDAVLADLVPPSQNECPQRKLTQKPSLLDDGIHYLSMSMLALQYRKLREMSLLGHVSVKLRDIDVNSYQLLSRLKELKRRGLLTPEEESKGFLDRSLTAEFIVRTVLDECQMFNESTDLLSLNPIDQATAEYDAR